MANTNCDNSSQIRENNNFKIKCDIDNNNNYSGKKWPQILSILSVSLGSVTAGIQYVWSSPFSLVIANDPEYDINEQDVSLFMLFQPVGMIVMCLFFSLVSDKLGRKKCLILLTIPQIVTWIITIFARNKWEFFIARTIAGWADAILFLSIPAYIGEISTPMVRDFWGNVPTFALYCGELLITIIGSYCSVRLTAYICLVIPVIYGILTLTLLPESPYQLIKDGKLDEAKKTIYWLQRFKCDDELEKEFFKIKRDVERQLSERGTWKDLFIITSNRRALFAGIFLRMSQQLSGISAFASYCQTIFQRAGGNLSPQLSSIIYNLLCAIGNLIAAIFVAKLGRKFTYFYSSLSTGAILIIMTVFYFIDEYHLADLTNFQWFPITTMLTYVCTMSFGLGIVPTLMLGELFSASIKAKGLTALIVVFGFAVLLGANLYHVLVSTIGFYSPFLFFGVVCLISSFLTLKWVPETKGKTLEEIQQDLKR